MLTAIRIGNFKAFAETQKIPVRPLTLIYGANSSGKSSIIHSLIFAQHAQESGDLDVSRTKIGGEAVDLGGFGQFVHRRDVTRRIEWSAEMDADAFTGIEAQVFRSVKHLMVSVSLGRTLDNQERPLPDTNPEVHSYDVLCDHKNLIRMSRHSDGKLHIDQLDYKHPVLQNLAGFPHKADNQPLNYDNDVFANGLSDLVVSKGGFLPEGLGYPEDSPFLGVAIGDMEIHEKRLLFYRNLGNLNELIVEIAETVQKELNSLQYLGPLRSYPPRHLVFLHYHDTNWFAGGGNAWSVILRDAKVREEINNWLSDDDRLQTPYELIARELVDIDKLDEPLLKGFEQIGDEVLDLQGETDVDPQHAEGLPMPLAKDPGAEVAKIKDIIRSSDIEKINDLIMIDKRSNTIVSHRDVGIGISQVLPVLASAYAAQHRIIAIEQPEIHLHPALQADLGDVFIQSALGGNENRFLIETHSEHLLLRVMRRMRETNDDRLPDGVPKITPKDVCILFVQPNGTSSVIRHLELDEEGRLLDPWPGGFFEEGYRERFA